MGPPAGPSRSSKPVSTCYRVTTTRLRTVPAAGALNASEKTSPRGCRSISHSNGVIHRAGVRIVAVDVGVSDIEVALSVIPVAQRASKTAPEGAVTPEGGPLPLLIVLITSP